MDDMMAHQVQNSFLEFLQRGRFPHNMQKPPPGPSMGMAAHPPHQMLENNNPAEFHQPAMAHQSMMGNHGALSVEELEARLRQAGPTANSSNNIPSDVNAMKNSQQQDMIAFKKLVNMCT